MYTQADLSLCWSHIPHCWKSHVDAHDAFESVWVSKTGICISMPSNHEVLCELCEFLPFHFFYQLCSTVGNLSGSRYVSDCISRGREFDPGPVPYFRGD